MNIKIFWKRRKKVKAKENGKSVQQWLPFEKIYNNGIIKINNNKFIKIIKIIPINYNLKSELEKEAILNSYKNFLKTCNFDIQILIQSKKENLSTHFSSVKKQSQKENKKISEISKKYINFIQEIICFRNSTIKNFYILINSTKDKNNFGKTENMIFDELNSNYFIIKENLSRCGNIVINISNKKEIKNIFYSFLNKEFKN